MKALNRRNGVCLVSALLLHAHKLKGFPQRRLFIVQIYRKAGTPVELGRKYVAFKQRSLGKSAFVALILCCYYL